MFHTITLLMIIVIYLQQISSRLYASRKATFMWDPQPLLGIFTTLRAMSFVRKYDFSHRRCWVWNRTSCTTHCGKCVILKIDSACFEHHSYVSHIIYCTVRHVFLYFVLAKEVQGCLAFCRF